MSLNLPLLALAIAAFGIGTTEFVIMGLLPDVAQDLSVSIPMAGLLITGYALAVAIGAPIMAVGTAKLPRKKALLFLMAIFIIGNALCALSPNYTILMVARVVTALCHGAFFGIGSVAAASLAPPERRASAMAMMFMGLTLANVLGVPFGTMLGQETGWRMTFWAVTAIGLIAFAALAKFMPAAQDVETSDLRQELRAVQNVKVWMALGITVLLSASCFTLFTYIAPILGEITTLTPRGVSYTLLLVGVGLTVGNYIGGRLADSKLVPSLMAIFLVVTALQLLFHWTAPSLIPAEINLFVWGMAMFAGCSIVHFNAITTGSAAPNLIATLNVGAFNVGNALGAWAGGIVIDAGFGLSSIPLAAAGFSVLGFGLVMLFLHKKRKDNLETEGLAVAN